jgi:hypothetical protein
LGIPWGGGKILFAHGALTGGSSGLPDELLPTLPIRRLFLARIKRREGGLCPVGRHEDMIVMEGSDHVRADSAFGQRGRDRRSQPHRLQVGMDG